MRTSDAEVAAVALMTAAAANDDACAVLATRLAFAALDHRVLVSFCLIEACWSWAPPAADSQHPLLGPTLAALRAGHDSVVRSLLVEAMTRKATGSYAALLVQLAYATVRLVPGIDDRLKARGLAIATDFESAPNRAAGPSR